MEQLAISNWWRYQHYKERRPPWVKFYVDALTDTTLLALPVPTRLVAALLLLVAGNRDNSIPNDATWLAVECEVTRAQAKRALAELQACGYLVTASEYASAFASRNASTDASEAASENAIPRARPRTRTETETETEKKTPKGVSSDQSIGRIHTHWLNITGRDPNRYRTISPARRQKIASRLREFTEADLHRSLDAVATDDWADRGKFTDLTVLFRSREKVDHWLDLATGTNGHDPEQARALADEQRLKRISDMQRERGWVE